MHEDQEAGTPLNEGADRGPVAGTLDAIALPVPDLDTVLDLLGPVGDHRHPGQPATSPLAVYLAATATPLGRTRDIDVGS